jgi:hypothetical protein
VQESLEGLLTGRLHDAQAGRVVMRMWAAFLNNSSSRWEPIWENWPLHLELMDIVSPIYRSDFQRRVSGSPMPWAPFCFQAMLRLTLPLGSGRQPDVDNFIVRLSSDHTCEEAHLPPKKQMSGVWF